MPPSAPKRIAPYIDDVATAEDLLRILNDLNRQGRELRTGQRELSDLDRIARSELLMMERAKGSESIEKARASVATCLNDMDTIIHGSAFEPVRVENPKPHHPSSFPQNKESVLKTQITRVSDKLTAIFNSLKAEINKTPEFKRPNHEGLNEEILDDIMRLEGTSNREAAIARAKKIRENLARLARIMSISAKGLDEIDASINNLADKVEEAVKQVDQIISALPPEQRDDFLRRLYERIKDEVPPKSDRVPMSAVG